MRIPRSILRIIRPSAGNRMKGATLMEAMVVVAIITVVLVMMAQIFVVGYDILTKKVAQSENDIGSILAVRSISETARGATTVVASRSVNGTTYTSGAEEIVLEMPSLDSNSDIIDGQFDYVAVFRDGTDPTRIHSDTQVGTGSVRPSGIRLITANNSDLYFRYNAVSVTDATRVSVYLRNMQTVRSTTIVSEAWTAIFLRNKQ